MILKAFSIFSESEEPNDQPQLKYLLNLALAYAMNIV